jgi:hypothetical protein
MFNLIQWLFKSGTEHAEWTGTFRTEFNRKIRNGPRFKMRWNLFHFVPFFELVWNVSAIPDETERNWQPCWFSLHATTLAPTQILGNQSIIPNNPGMICDRIYVNPLRRVIDSVYFCVLKTFFKKIKIFLFFLL